MMMTNNTPSPAPSSPHESGKELGSRPLTPVPSNMDVIWDHFDQLNSLLADIITTDCTFITAAYQDRSLFRTDHAHLSPSQPPFLVHRLVLEVMTLMLDHVHSASALGSFVYTVLLCLEAFPENLTASVMQFLCDGWMPRMSVLARRENSDLQFAACIAEALAEQSLDEGMPVASGPDRMSSGSSKLDEPDTEAVGLSDVVVQMDDIVLKIEPPSLQESSPMKLSLPVTALAPFAGSQNSMHLLHPGMSLNQVHSSSGSFQGSKEKSASTSSLVRSTVLNSARWLPRVKYDQAFWPPILFALLQFCSRSRMNSSEVAQLQEEYYMQRMLEQIQAIRPDLSIDFLEQVATGNDVIRHQAMTCLMQIWPDSTGHFCISDSAVATTSMMTTEEVAVTAPAEETLPARTSSSVASPKSFGFRLRTISTPDQGSIDKLKSESTKALDALGQVKPSAQSYNLEKHSFTPHCFSKHGEKCASCSQPVEHFGAKCHGCGDGLHINCLRVIQRMRPGIFPAHIMQRLQSRAGIEQQGHQFYTVNLFATHVCHVCTDPIWGLSVQALCCKGCRLVAHPQCIVKVNHACTLSVPQAKRMPVVTADQLNLTLQQYYGSFLKEPTPEDLIRLYQPFEIVVISETLRVQEALLLAGFKSDIISIQGHITRIDNREHLAVVAPDFVKAVSAFSKLATATSQSHLAYGVLYSHEMLSVLAMKMKLPTDDGTGTLIDQRAWALKPTNKSNEEAKENEEAPAAATIQGDLLLELINIFPMEEWDDVKVDVFYGTDILDWLMGHSQLQYTLSAKLILQQMSNMGVLAPMKTLTGLNDMENDESPKIATNVKYVSPIPHPVDAIHGAEVLIDAIHNLLLLSNTVKCNEFAFMLLIRQCNPSYWNQLYPEERVAVSMPPIAITTSTGSLVFSEKGSQEDFDGPVEYSRGQQLVRHLIWMIVVWFSRNEASLIKMLTDSTESENIRRNSSGSGHSVRDSSDSVRSSFRSQKNADSGKQLPITVDGKGFLMKRKALFDRYALPWLKSVQLAEHAFYDQALSDAVASNNGDPQASQARTQVST
jgi:hypothetical protein